jgi:hypothetical protein
MSANFHRVSHILASMDLHLLTLIEANVSRHEAQDQQENARTPLPGTSARNGAGQVTASGDEVDHTMKNPLVGSPSHFLRDATGRKRKLSFFLTQFTQPGSLTYLRLLGTIINMGVQSPRHSALDNSSHPR